MFESCRLWQRASGRQFPFSPLARVAGRRILFRFRSAPLGTKSGRRVCAFIGLFGAAIVLLLGSRIQNPYVAVCVLSLGAGFNAFSTVSFWAVTIDITREYAGSLSGLMNMAGNIGGAISPTLTPYLAERYGWTAAIDTAALAIGSAGLVWFFIDANRQLRISTIPIDSRISAARR